MHLIVALQNALGDPDNKVVHVPTIQSLHHMMLHHPGGDIIAVKITPLITKPTDKKRRQSIKVLQSFCILSPYINNIFNYTYTTTSYLVSLSAFRALLTWISPDTLQKSQSKEGAALEDMYKFWGFISPEWGTV